jgi:hypothetical protein
MIMNERCESSAAYGAMAGDLGRIDDAIEMVHRAEQDPHLREIPAPWCSTLYNDGVAHLDRAVFTGSSIDADTAEARLTASLAFRGPDRPQVYAQTCRALADLELARASWTRGAAARRHADAAVARLSDALVALRGQRLPVDVAALQAALAGARLARAERTPGDAELRAIAALLDSASSRLGAERFPAQAAACELMRAGEERLAARLGRPGARAAARAHLERAAMLLPAPQDPGFAKRVDRERALQAAAGIALR